jgi:hypothetical protein
MRFLTLALVASSLVACSKPEEKPAPAASATAASAAPAVTAKPVEAKATVTTWQGDFTTKAAPLYLPSEKEYAGVKVKDFDQTGALGAGKIKVTVSPEGVATGTLSGVLGDLAITGRRDGDRVSGTFGPAAGDGFYGFFACNVEGDKLTGTLTASAAQANAIRTAELSLTK